MHVNEQTTDMLMWMGKETTEWDGVAMVEAHSFKDIFAVSIRPFDESDLQC